MSIYTKTGDKGETGLLGGRRVEKSCIELRVIGEVDELNAALGVAAAFLKYPSPCPSPKRGGIKGGVSLATVIQSIQRDLFKIGAELASLQTPLEEKIEKINNGRIVEMEKMIDKFWSELPELKNFILPGGSEAGARLHLARAICRRAERQLVEFAKTTSIRPELNMYLNRLSDFLFAAARWVNFKAGEEEIKV